MLALPEASRFSLVDILVTNADNQPASVDDARSFRQTTGLDAQIPTVVDSTFSLRGLLPQGGGPAPLYVLIDRRTLRVERVVSNPDLTSLRNEVRGVLAGLDQAPTPPLESEPLVDGFFRRNEWDMLREVRVPGTPPPEPTNRFSDNPRAAQLGKALFSSPALSPTGTIACSTCHDPNKHWSDDQALASGLGAGVRRTPPIALAAHSRWQFWDGRADTLWAQALGPLENPAEHGSSRLYVARRIAELFHAEYMDVFGEDPRPITEGLPSEGKPGDPAYEALSQASKQNVTRIFVNVGKAIAAFERTLRVLPNRLDAYLAGDNQALSTLEKEGLSMFAQVGCMQCHWGPRLTDDAFHNVRLPGRATGSVDRGRADGIAALLAGEFRADSVWSDDRTARTMSPLLPLPSDVGSYKTPSLRGVADVRHFGHAGAVGDLRDVLELYGKGGVPLDDPRGIGAGDPWLVEFGFTAQWGIPKLLMVLTAEPAPH